MRGWTIGGLAKQTGVNLETVRYYERVGLMPRPDRTARGYRSYSRDDVRRLSFIRRAREMGFSLAAIRTLLSLSEPGQRSCADVRGIAVAHLANVHAKLADLARLEHILAEAVARCGGGEKVPACPVLDMLDSDGGG